MKKDKLDFLKKEFHSKKKEIKNRLTEFSKVSQEFVETCLFWKHTNRIV